MADASNTSKQSKRSPAIWISIIVVAIIVLAGVVYYSRSTNTDGNENSSTVINSDAVVTNQNTNQLKATIQRINDKTTVTVTDFTLSIPGDWYTTEIDRDSNSDLLFTASNENTDAVLGINDRNSGFVMHLSAQPYSKSISSYLLENPVNVGSLVKQEKVTVGQNNGQVREVDATAIDSMEGSYSLAYFFKQNDYILQVLFLSLSANAIDNNRPSIDAVIQSLL